MKAIAAPMGLLLQLSKSLQCITMTWELVVQHVSQEGIYIPTYLFQKLVPQERTKLFQYGIGNYLCAGWILTSTLLNRVIRFLLLVICLRFTAKKISDILWYYGATTGNIHINTDTSCGNIYIVGLCTQPLSAHYVNWMLVSYISIWCLGKFWYFVHILLSTL